MAPTNTATTLATDAGSGSTVGAEAGTTAETSDTSGTTTTRPGTSDTGGTTTETDTEADPCMTWDRTYGGVAAEFGRAIVAVPNGGFAVAGRTASKGAGDNDMWLVRLDEAGDVLWDRTYGTAVSEHANGLVVAPDGGFLVVGNTTTPANSLDWWIVRTDADGNELWDETFSTPDGDHAFAAVAASDGGFAVAGTRDRVGQGTGRFWLIRLDDDGTTLWQRIYGDPAEEQLAYDLVEFPGGGFAVTGTAHEDFWLVRTDEAGNELWNRSYDHDPTTYDRATALVRTPDDGLVLAGWSQGNNSSDYWVVRTDTAGNVLWSTAYDQKDSDFAEDVALLEDGGLLLVGGTAPYAAYGDLWAVRTDADGAILWDRTLGGGDQDHGYGVVAFSGGLAFVGTTASKGAGDGDVWALRTNSEGLFMCP